MGKRKKATDLRQTDPPPSGGTMPCSSKMELLSEKKPLDKVDFGELPLPSAASSSMKLLNIHPSATHLHQSPGRSILLKRSRHQYAYQYTRRNSTNHANAFLSRGKGCRLLADDRVSFKLATESSTEFAHNLEIKENTLSGAEKNSGSVLLTDTMLPDVMKRVCGICQKLLRRKPLNLGSILSSSELSAVAVLVCGHAYHADCLEQRTFCEDRRDPSCPLCSGLL